MKTSMDPTPRSNLLRGFLQLFVSNSAAKPGSMEASLPGQPPAKPDELLEARKHILIVDDDPVILKTTSWKLQARGYAVSTALDGAGAIRAVREQRPDLILLDLSFPPDVAHGGTVAWDGFLIMSWLRRMDSTRQTPVIVITGADPARYQGRALTAGALAFFHKPIEHEDLLITIQETLNRQPVPSGLAHDTEYQI